MLKRCVVLSSLGVLFCAAIAESQENDFGKIVKDVSSLLSKEHYSRKPLDDDVSEKWLTEFISRLDPHKMYFLRADIEEFRRRERQLDDLARAADFSFAESIQQRLVKRVKSSCGVAKEMLSQQHDFTVDESFPRWFEGFAENERELRERWRLRIKFEILVERSNRSARNEITQFLSGRYTGILDEVQNRDAEGLCRVYLNSLAAVLDSHSEYLSESQLRQFRGRQYWFFTVGLGLRQHEGNYRISGMMLEFRKHGAPKSLVGWNILAIRRLDGTTYHLSERNEYYVSELIRGFGRQLKSDREVILELYHPVTHQRVSREWPRVRLLDLWRNV
jgi:carboxyl-terminal processing protease